MKKKIIITVFSLFILITAIIFIVGVISSYNYDIKNYSDDKWVGFGAVLTLMVGGFVVFYDLDLFYTVYYFFIKPKTIIKSILNILSNVSLLLIVFTDYIAHFLYSYVAQIIGETSKSEELKKRAEESRNEFNKRHLNKAGNDYDAKNQCGIILPLAFGMAPKDKRQALADTLVKYIKDNDYRVSTGFIGTRYMFDILSDYGYSDVAYKVFTNPAAPSWLDMLNSGATAITENRKGHNSTGSMSHFSLGAVCEWLFEYLGGIRINESEAGLKSIVLKPVMLKEIGSFSVKYKSQFGEIYTEWHFEDGKPVFNYSVPKGVKAEVII